MNEPKPLIFVDFLSEQNPLIAIKNSRQSTQSHYLIRYLSDLNASKVVVENNYFDRDFLAEFSAFYCLSAKGYPNVCKRIHFFSSDCVDREYFSIACGDDEAHKRVLQENYLGYIVVRPITDSPFGRTVLKWFPDMTPSTPRNTQPSRIYVCNVAGIELKVTGLAWQQQDSGVAACATIGIWTMLHSSAFNDRNAIPTTSMITEAAHSSALVGRPAYPSHFLQYNQIQHAIMQLGFMPAITSGDLPNQFFTKERFANTCAAYIRSGYPMLIGAIHNDGVQVGHAVCAVGFREAAPAESLATDKVSLQDDNIEYIYIHDDNIGPNVRFKLNTEKFVLPNGVHIERCALQMDAPAYLSRDQTNSIDMTTLIPQTLIAAVHQDLKITSDSFFRHGIGLASTIHKGLNLLLESQKLNKSPLVLSTRFIMLKDFLSLELGRQLQGEAELLSNVRMHLHENVPPMSLHLALLRIALPDASVLVDILFDTTDTDKNRSVFCHIIYAPLFESFLSPIDQEEINQRLGIAVRAY